MQSISLSRLLAALLFASLAFRNLPVAFIFSLYGLAVGSDLVDGFLARKLNAETHFGKVVDLISDKSLTIVSLLYAAARRMDVLPLALIATREILMIGARLITVKGEPLFPTSRRIGGMMALLLWGNTLFLIVAGGNDELLQIANIMFWACAFLCAVHFIARIYMNAQRIKVSLTGDR